MKSAPFLIGSVENLGEGLFHTPGLWARGGPLDRLNPHINHPTNELATAQGTRSLISRVTRCAHEPFAPGRALKKNAIALVHGG